MFIYRMYVCVLRNPVYLGNMLDDSRIHQIEQQIRVSTIVRVFCLQACLKLRLSEF